MGWLDWDIKQPTNHHELNNSGDPRASFALVGTAPVTPQATETLAWRLKDRCFGATEERQRAWNGYGDVVPRADTEVSREMEGDMKSSPTREHEHGICRQLKANKRFQLSLKRTFQWAETNNFNNLTAVHMLQFLPKWFYSLYW